MIPKRAKEPPLLHLALLRAIQPIKLRIAAWVEFGRLEHLVCTFQASGDTGPEHHQSTMLVDAPGKHG